jgi:hypothetical protein
MAAGLNPRLRFVVLAPRAQMSNRLLAAAPDRRLNAIIAYRR